MKGKFTCALAVAMGISSLGWLSACNTVTTESYSKTIYAMGTYATLTVSKMGFSAKKFTKLSDRVEEFLTSADNSLSASRVGSCVYDFNGAGVGERVEIDWTTYEVLGEALAAYTLTGGKFNPAIWHNANAYHLAVGADDGEKFDYLKEGNALPDKKYIDKFNELSAQFYDLYLEQSEGKYYATKPDYMVSVEGDTTKYSMRIDLGGIAKGWCADKVNEMMAESGAKYGNFNFGMSSIAVKKYAGATDREYDLRLRDPRKELGNSFFEIKVKDAAVSTSGDYEKYYELDGVRYCHIIDPTTGAPIRTGVASVTVIGKGGALTDALTDALAAMDKERAVKFINEKLTDYKVVMLIFEEGVGKVITNCPKDIKIVNDSYALANTVTDGKIVLS